MKAFSHRLHSVRHIAPGKRRAKHREEEWATSLLSPWTSVCRAVLLVEQRTELLVVEPGHLQEVRVPKQGCETTRAGLVPDRISQVPRGTSGVVPLPRLALMLRLIGDGSRTLSAVQQQPQHQVVTKHGEVGHTHISIVLLLQVYELPHHSLRPLSTDQLGDIFRR